MTEQEFYKRVASNTLKLSYSSIRMLSVCPRSFFEYFTTEKKETTPAMLYGEVFHALLLEPAIFERDYLVQPANANKASNANKAVLADFEQVLGNRIAVPQKIYEEAALAVSYVRKKEAIAPYLYGDKEVAFEVTIEGIPFRGKIDVKNMFGKVDIKTCEDATDTHSFQRKAIWDFDYPLQAAIYTHDGGAYFILACDKKGYSQVHRFTQERLARASERLRELIGIYKMLQIENTPETWRQEREFYLKDSSGVNII